MDDDLGGIKALILDGTLEHKHRRMDGRNLLKGFIGDQYGGWIWTIMRQGPFDVTRISNELKRWIISGLYLRHPERMTLILREIHCFDLAYEKRHSNVAFLGLVPNIAGLAILLASDGRNSPGMSTDDDDDKYGQCLLFEAPEDFQRLWHILEAEILEISLSKASIQLKEGRFDDVLEAIHSIWAPSQAHSIVVDFLPPHTEEVASNRRFFYGKALQSEREDHSGAYLYFPLPDGVFSDRLGYGSCSPNKLSSDILVHLCIKMKKVLPMSMAALEAAHDTLVTLNAPSDIWIDYFEFMPNLTCVALIVRRSANLLPVDYLQDREDEAAVIGGSDLDLLFQLMKEELLAFEATVFKRFEAPPGSAGMQRLVTENRQAILAKWKANGGSGLSLYPPIQFRC